MPLNEDILGFSNRCYKGAMESAVTRQLPPDLRIRLLTAPCFIATKLEAFKGRARGDFLRSHDLEDVVSVVDGRATLPDEVRHERPDLRAYLRSEIEVLLVNPGFTDALPGFLLPDAASQSRVDIVLRRLKELASG